MSSLSIYNTGADRQAKSTRNSRIYYYEIKTVPKYHLEEFECFQTFFLFLLSFLRELYWLHHRDESCNGFIIEMRALLALS